MSNKRIYVVAVIVIFLIVGVIVWGMKQSNTAKAPTVEKFGPTQNEGQQNQATDIVYYYRNDCPHCTDLSKWLDDNKISDKVAFVKKEIHDQANADELQKRAGECNIPPDQIGVPFIYGKGQCYVGTPNAETFFKQEAGIQ
ncbi:MAG TPA: hypothetical protein VF390_01200 [Patescibacteria group bacterium]